MDDNEVFMPKLCGVNRGAEEAVVVGRPIPGQFIPQYLMPSLDGLAGNNRNDRVFTNHQPPIAFNP